MIKRLLFGGAAAVVAIVLTGGSAFAFECYNASRSATGNEHGGGNGLASIAEILANPEIVGLCPAGVDHVIEGLDDQGFKTDVLINQHTLMAGGLEKNGKGEDLLHDGQGIDHLSDAFFEAADTLIGEGFEICAD
jgi:hypothetical protein